MNISIIGSGYVGLVTGVCFAKLGNSIIFVDVDTEKINLLNKGCCPIYEPGVEELIQKHRQNITAVSTYESAIMETDTTIICVGTPSEKNGGLSLDFLRKAAIETGTILKKKNGWHLVIVKSTVLPGTTEQVVIPLLEKYSGKKAGVDFGVAMNPEFLREGAAIQDFLGPDRIVYGFYDNKSRDKLRTIYQTFSCPKIETSLSTAEMVKYASNAFLAAKISYANEIGNICKKIQINVNEVFQAVGLDTRISPAFFKSGIGFGGSCFPKDVKALIHFADTLGSRAHILNAVMRVNETQPKKILELLQKYIPDIKGKTIGILGLSFKPETDDIRESRAIPIVKELLKKEADIVAYDPQAMNHFKQIFPKIHYASSVQHVLDSDAILILTEWKEFEKLSYSGKIVIDGRNLPKAKTEAKIYEGICW